MDLSLDESFNTSGESDCQEYQEGRPRCLDTGVREHQPEFIDLQSIMSRLKTVQDKSCVPLKMSEVAWDAWSTGKQAEEMSMYLLWRSEEVIYRMTL